MLVDEDPVSAAARGRRAAYFPHLPSMRREDRARRQKQRKREWLLKLYRDGLATGRITVRYVCSVAFLRCIFLSSCFLALCIVLQGRCLP